MSHRWTDTRRGASVGGARGRRLTAAAAAVAIGLVAAGCGRAGQGAAGASAHASDSVLTIAEPNVPATLDPASGANENADYFDPAYEPLIIQGPDGSFTPGLATHWRYGPRNMSFTMTLRPGVKFSDGTSLDAHAVKVWLAHALRLPGGRAPSYLKSLTSVDVLGPLKVRLRFSAPTPLLELTFSQRFEMGDIASPRAVAAKRLDNATAGAGPYALDPSQTVNGDHYTYVPNRHYYRQSAIHYKRIVLKVISNPTSTLQALESGQVQMAVSQPVTSVAAAKKAGLSVVAPQQLIEGLALLDRAGKLAKPLGDVRVRQAINDALDRSAIARVVGSGYGRPAEQIAVPGDDSYDPALNRRYPYDPAKARRLLAQAGYPHGFTLPAVSTTIVGQDTLGQAIAGQLAKVGITLKLDVRPTVADYIKVMSAAQAPSATLAFGRLPATILYQLLWGPAAGTFNPFRTSDARLAALNRRLSAATRSQGPAIARRMQALTVDQAWFAPVASTPLVTLYSGRVKGVSAAVSRPVIFVPEIAPRR